MPKLRQNWHLAGEGSCHVSCTQKRLHIISNAASPRTFVLQPLSLQPAEAGQFKLAGHGLLSVVLAHLSVEVDGAPCNPGLAALHQT